MNEQPHSSEALFREIARYLAVVDLYRAEHCEPTWLPEPAPRGAVLELFKARAEHATSAH